MSNAKISALTSATTPLAGTEVLPIVQSGATVKVAVSDLTAARSVGMSKLTITQATNPVAQWDWTSGTSRQFLVEGTGNLARLYSGNLGAVVQQWDVTTGATRINYQLTIADNLVIGTSGKGLTDSTGALTSTYNSTGITTNGTVSAGHVYRFGTYTAGATTPSVLGVSCMVITNASPTTITNFTNAVSGQILTLIFTDSNTTVARNNAYLSGGLNFTSTASDTLTLICSGTEWFEVSRSINS
jgi:hypothetical protein